MLRPSRLAALAALVALGGCSALINPDTGRLGDEPDSGVVALMDSGGPVGSDAGPGFDAGDGSCSEGERRCNGDQLLTCVAGTFVAADCQAMGAFCEGGTCRPHVCVPNSRMCSADRGSVVSCSARGDEASEDDCGEGECNPDTIRCEGGGDACPLDDLPRALSIPDSRMRVLCRHDDNHTFTPSDACRSMTRAAVGDEVLPLVLDRERRLTFQLTDVDEDAAVDTILYIRRACDDPSTQVACADDVPCMASTVDPPACFGEVDVRQSRVTVTLPAGTYYVFLDAFEYTTSGTEFGCGRVELQVRPAE